MAKPPARDWTGIALVVVVALVASLAGLDNDFAQDDLYLIRDNLRVHSLGSWREILTNAYWPPPWNQELYRPVTSLLHALQFTIGGGLPVVFRLASYALYAGGAVALFLLAARELPRTVALGAAVLFAAHPVHVEAVALAVGQGELLVALAAALMVSRYLDCRARGAVGPRDWLALAGLYLVASFAKEQGLLLPALLVAAEAFLVPGPLRARIRAAVPIYAGLAGVAALAVALRLALLGGSFARNFTAEAIQGVGFGGRFLTMLQVAPEWFRLLLWPAHLQADYSPQEIVASTGFGGPEALGAALLLLAGAVLVFFRRRAPMASFGLAWTAIALFPVTNLVLLSGVVLAERTLFLPSAGLLLAVGGLAAWVGELIPESGRPRLRTAALAGCGLLAVAGVLRSGERHRTWRNEAFFAVRSVQDAPRSFRTRRAYAEVLFELGQRQLGLEAYQEAIALAPAGNRWRVRNDFARRLRVLGETGLETDQLEASLAENPDQEDTAGYLVAALLALGRYRAAAEAARQAIGRGVTQEAAFAGMVALADSAERAGAPPGAIRIRVKTTSPPVGPRE